MDTNFGDILVGVVIVVLLVSIGNFMQKIGVVETIVIFIIGNITFHAGRYFSEWC